MRELRTLPMYELDDMKDLNEKNYMLLLREALNNHLEINNISPEDFAKRAGVTGRTVRYICEGRTDDIKAGNMFRIFSALYSTIKISIPTKK